MRKCFVLLCGLLLVSGCAWQGAAEGTGEASYVLYFLERDLNAAAGGGVFRTELARMPETESPDTRQIAESLLADLLDGPVDETLVSPIPTGTTLLSFQLEGARATVDMSSAYGALSGVALTLADQAVALTLTQLPDILSVKITVRGRELAYRDKQVFTAQDILLAPQGDVVGTTEAALYFLNERGGLTGETRTLELYEGDTQVGAVARALENGPEDNELSPILPEGFRVKSVWQEEDVCYVNLSSGLLDTVPEEGSLEIILRALARSFCSLEAVGETRFLVDGEFAEYYGSVHVGQSYIG